MIKLIGQAFVVSILLGAGIPQTGPSDVPEKLKAPAGEQLILTTHATGFQIYVCGVGGPDQPLRLVVQRAGSGFA